MVFIIFQIFASAFASADFHPLIFASASASADLHAQIFAYASASADLEILAPDTSLVWTYLLSWPLLPEAVDELPI